VAILTLEGNRLLPATRHILYNHVRSFGKVKLQNTTVDKEQPFNYYEQQGVVTSGFLHVGDAAFPGEENL